MAILFSAGAALVASRPRHDVAPRLTDVELVDQNGAPRSLGSWSGRVLVLDFIYTGCGDLCPLKTSQLVDVQRALDPALRRRVQFVSVSIDPEHDDPAALKAYAKEAGADLSDWSFLTGDLARIARIAATFGATFQAGGDVPEHIMDIRVIDPNWHSTQLVHGEPLDEPRLRQAIAALSATPTRAE